MKPLIITGLSTVLLGTAIWFVGGWTALLLSVLIPLFLLVPVAVISISLFMGLLDGIADFIGNSVGNFASYKQADVI